MTVSVMVMSEVMVEAGMELLFVKPTGEPSVDEEEVELLV